MSGSGRKHVILVALAALVIGLVAPLLMGTRLAAAESSQDAVAIAGLSPDVAKGIVAGGAYHFEAAVNYKLLSTTKAYLAAFVFEGQNDLPSAKSVQAVPIDQGAGRTTVDVSYQTPATGVRTIQIFVVMLRDSKTVLAWTDTDNIPVSPVSNQPLFQAAMEAYGLQDYGTAIDKLTQAIALDPNVPQLYQWRGDAESRNGQNDQAQVDFTRALELAPNDPAILVARGVVRMWLRNWNSAVADFNAVIAQPKASQRVVAWAYRGRGVSYSVLGDTSAAIADYRSYLRYQPHGDDRSEVLGWIADLGGN